MIILRKNRKYKTGFGNSIIIKDCARVKLNNNEQITFQKKNFLYDFCKKNWGYYVTASINKRLKENGFEVYLVENLIGSLFLFVLEKDKKKEFLDYLKNENQKIITRLDNVSSAKNIIINYNKECRCFDTAKDRNKSEQFSLYLKPPPNEPDYGIKKYKRRIFRCNKCGHFRAVHNIDTKKFYHKNYSLISHGKNIEKKFKKILNLKKKVR